MSERVARWVSILAHPFVMVALLVAVSASRVRSAATGATSPGSPAISPARAVLLVMMVSLVPVALLIVRQVRSGRWSNVDASRKSERPILFVVAFVALGALLLWLQWRDPHSFLIRGGLVTGGMLLVAAAMTRWIKVSLHLAFATLTAVGLTLLQSAAGYALLPVVPLLAWSRLTLSRHTAWEVMAGIILGAGSAWLLVRW